jgi:hypothetical protein
MYCPDFAIHGYRTDKGAAAAKESEAAAVAPEPQKEAGDAR